MADRRTKKRYPTGPRWPMTPEWKAAVRKRLDELGMTQSALAKAAGVSPGAITLMLGDQVSSVAVPAVSKALGIGRPLVDVEDRVTRAVRALDEKGRLLLLELAEDMANRQRK